MSHTPYTQPQKQGSPAPAGTGRGFKCNNSLHLHDTKPQPPFANWLRSQNRVLLFAGGHACWEAARSNLAAGRDAVALPVGQDPRERNWNCVSGRSVIVIELDDTGPGNRATLVRMLAAWGALEVALVPHDCCPQNAVFWGC